MNLGPRLRKFVLTLHVTSSVGWVGAILAYLALAVAVPATEDASKVRAAWIAMELTGWFVIVPLSLASLLSGVIQALGTPWGLVRHYWVVLKLLLTIFATTILLLHMPDVSQLASAVSRLPEDAIGGFRSDLLHAGGGLGVLLLTLILGMYKPQGMTRYGWRKRHGSRNRA